MSSSLLTSNPLEETPTGELDALKAFFPGTRDVFNADLVFLAPTESWADTRFYRDTLNLLKRLNIPEIFPFTPTGVRLALMCLYWEKWGKSYMPHDIVMWLREILENPESYQKREDTPTNIAFWEDDLSPSEEASIYIKDPFRWIE